MGNLIINENVLTPTKAEEIVKICPFGAISYDNGKLNISSACKMCKLCVKKSDGVIEYKEEEKKAWTNLNGMVSVYMQTILTEKSTELHMNFVQRQKNLHKK